MMSDSVEISQTATEHIEALISEMYAGKHDNNHMLLGTLHSGDEPLQIQLLVTRNPEEFLDEQ